MPALQKLFATKGFTYQPHRYYLKPAVNRQPGFRRGARTACDLQMSQKTVHTHENMLFLKKHFFAKNENRNFDDFLSQPHFSTHKHVEKLIFDILKPRNVDFRIF